jgi:biotin carboxyl carrier protein
MEPIQHSVGLGAASPPASRRPGRRAYILITLFALALVLFPFLFWYNTWFGRKLDDTELDRYFSDSDKPRHAQHALVQLGERVAQHQNISHWYPRVMEQSASPSLEIRQTAAWVMGQDRGYAPFHEALLRLIRDPQPMVRRNAALALAGFNDAVARPELVAMLRPYTVLSPARGALKYRLKPGDYVNPGTLLARVGESEVRSPVPGEVRSLAAQDGRVVQAGDPLADLAADKNHVWEALRALYLVGQAEDLEQVQRFTRPVPGMPDTVVRQALLTAQAIQSRKSGP